MGVGIIISIKQTNTQNVTTYFHERSGERPPFSDDHYNGHDGNHADRGDSDQGADTVRPAGELHLVVLRGVEVNGREQ